MADILGNAAPFKASAPLQSSCPGVTPALAFRGLLRLPCAESPRDFRASSEHPTRTPIRERRQLAAKTVSGSTKRIVVTYKSGLIVRGCDRTLVAVNLGSPLPAPTLGSRFVSAAPRLAE